MFSVLTEFCNALAVWVNMLMNTCIKLRRLLINFFAGKRDEKDGGCEGEERD